MANKRDLKKAIRNTCGAIALDMVQAREAFPAISIDAVRDVVLEAARLQITTLGHVGVSFDRTPKQFENGADYNKARRTFYKEAYRKLNADFIAGIEAIVKQMNEALPEEARKAIKEAIN